MAFYTEKMVVNRRGQSLHTVQYPSSNNKPAKALIIWHHGYGEHVGRYDKVFRQLSEAGYSVFSYDAHGHGKSEPKTEPFKSYVEDYNHLVDDLYCYLDTIISEHPQQLPIYAAGHSMGGLVATLAVLRDPARWNGLLLHSANMDVEWTPVLRMQASVGGLLAALLPRARLVPAVRPDDMSSDPQAVKNYVEDPLNYVGNVKCRTANELLKAYKFVGMHSRELRLPMYAAHGTNDKCCSLPAVQRLFAAASSTDKTLNLIEGGYHELLHGPGWDKYTDELLQWLDSHTQTGSSSITEATQTAAKL